MMGDTPTHANGQGMATEIDETSGGQSDTHRDKGITTGTHEKISSPSHEQHTKASGHRKTASDSEVANGITTSAAKEPINVDNPPDSAEGPVVLSVESVPKKKKKRSKRKKKVVATGYEEYYADAPMTPAQAAQEKKEIYGSLRPFPSRIEECIQRYRANRRMDHERTLLFDKYLWLGGIDPSPRQFTGFAEDREALEGRSADEIRQMTATDFVGGGGTRFYDPVVDPDNWFVDFEGIVKCFLSRMVPVMYMYDEAAIRMAADLLKNFLNYVLLHEVCPEYTDNIQAARRICDIAPMEMRMMHELLNELPGPFNSLATSLFYDRQINKCVGTDNFDDLIVFRVTVLSSMPGTKIDRTLKATDDPTTIRVTKTKEETYQVMDIVWPRQKDIRMVTGSLKELGHSGKGEPVGILILKPSIIDMGYDNVPLADNIDLEAVEAQEYLLESNLLTKFSKGMKIKAVVCELNIGLRFIKEIKDIRVSFDLFLPQMLMEGWKDHVLNDRPPPSASNPNGEEKAEEIDD
ncbi:Argonaute siRNA chaperone complex subunit Arb1-domain-containing protein [Hypomontagnella monticulosa]|nr:Argonaute siRNA chaperone complex subunit Arb1-domain-containing protein [Hypomontagnella monticulosa]